MVHTEQSHKGRRASNEDNLKIANITVDGTNILIASLADGMGGHLSGEVASRMAVELFVGRLEDAVRRGRDEEHLRAAVRDAFQEINQEILARGRDDPQLADMGTTLTAAVVVEGRYLIASLGDSRAYRIREEDIRQLTEDHSAGVQSLKEGLISEAEARESRYANSLTKFLGTTESYPPDIFPERGFYQAENGEILLLCTDGISGFLDEFRIYESVVQTRLIDHAAKNLVAEAFVQGSRDNMSVILVEISPLTRREPFLSPRPLPLSRKPPRALKKRAIIALIIACLALETALVMGCLKYLRPSRPKPPAAEPSIIKPARLEQKPDSLETDHQNEIAVQEERPILAPGQYEK